MTGPSRAFQIDDEVEIIGPSILGDDRHLGEKFVISGLSTITQHVPYSPYDGMYYPASSLRLVEPGLKIGGYAEVILKGSAFTGRVGKVTDDSGIETVALYNMGVWHRENLRKLTPEEVAKHTSKNIGEFTATLKLDTSEFEAGIDKMQDKLWKLQVEQRIAAIEKRQEQQRIAFNTLSERTENRLAFLEASQKDAMESPLDGEKRIRARLEDRRLFVLQQIATGMQEICEGRGLLEMGTGKFWLAELAKVEKQIAEGQ